MYCGDPAGPCARGHMSWEARPHLPQVAPSAAWAAVSIPPPHQTSPDRSFVVSLGSGPVSIKGDACLVQSRWVPHCRPPWWESHTWWESHI